MLKDNWKVRKVRISVGAKNDLIEKRRVAGVKGKALSRANKKNTQVGTWSSTGEPSCQGEYGRQGPPFLPAPPSSSPRQLEASCPKASIIPNQSRQQRNPCLEKKHWSHHPSFWASLWTREWDSQSSGRFSSQADTRAGEARVIPPFSPPSVLGDTSSLLSSLFPFFPLSTSPLLQPPARVLCGY